MPPTRSSKTKGLQQEASEVPDIHPAREASTGAGWNDYLNWDLPEFTYQEGSSTEPPAPDPDWYTSDRTISTHKARHADDLGSTRDAANGISERNIDQSTGPEFYGLQGWYSSATQNLSSASSEANSPPRLADSTYSSYEQTSFGEANSKLQQPGGIQPWSPVSNRTELSSDETVPDLKLPSTEDAESVHDLSGSPSPQSAKETDRASAAARLAANKKRKIAHSVIEKNYRSRIKDGMAELRDCVPSTKKGRTSSLDSIKTELQLVDKAQQNHSSGKVATLSDAVEYVKSLELRNEALHGKLDIMQRRNDTLQRIALSKVDISNPPKDEGLEGIDQEEAVELAENDAAPSSRKRSKTSPSGRHRL